MPEDPTGLWSVYAKVAGHTASELSSVLLVWGFICWMWAWYHASRLSKGWALGCAVVWLVPHLLIPAGGGDIFNYVEQGWVVLQGGNPSVDPAGSIAGPFSQWVGAWGGTTVGYPPLALSIQAGVVWLANSIPWVSLLLMRLPALLGLLLLLWAALRLADQFSVNKQTVFWFIALNPFVILLGISAAHYDIVAAGLVLAGVAVALTAAAKKLTWPLAVALILAGGLVKPNALLLAALWPLVLLLGVDRLADRGKQVKALLIAGVTTVVGLAGVLAVSALTPFGVAWTRPTGNPAWASNSLYSVSVGVLGKLAGKFPGAGQLAGFISTYSMVLCAGAVVLIIGGLALGRRLSHIAWIPTLTLMLLVVIGPAGRPWYLLPAVASLVLVGYEAKRLFWITVVICLWQMPRYWTTFSYLSAQLWSWLGALTVLLIIYFARPAEPEPLSNQVNATTESGLAR